MFGNPVAGRIRPPRSRSIFGNFRVTSSFADHEDDGRPLGVDIGNGHCGEPILAIADGVVTEAGFIGAALVVRIRHPQFPGHVSGYAHLATIEPGIAKDLPVSRGDRIGTLGRTGATACHLHLGLKLNGQEIDSWPHLDQNTDLEAEMLKGQLIQRVVNRQTLVLANGTRFRRQPDTNEAPLAMYEAGRVFIPDFLVVGESVGGSARWLGGWANTPQGIEFGYMSETVLGPLTRFEP
jgi:murein DD-endopeptidase MepM/ murein hydrolase activator NlpD